ncbi:hypothetical protein [Nostoc sp.]
METAIVRLFELRSLFAEQQRQHLLDFILSDSPPAQFADSS